MNGLSRMAAAFGASALVIKRFAINEAGPLFVEVEGRRSGVVAWILAHLGFDTTTTLRVYATHAELDSGSLAGRIKEMVPLSRVSRLGTSYLKPFGYLIMAALVVYRGYTLMHEENALVYAIMDFVGAGGLVLLYFFHKSLVLFFMPKSSVSMTIAFKRSVIEGQNIDKVAAKRIMSIVERLVGVETRRSPSSASLSGLGLPPRAAAAPHAQATWSSQNLPKVPLTSNPIVVLGAAAVVLVPILGFLWLFRTVPHRRGPAKTSTTASGTSSSLPLSSGIAPGIPPSQPASRPSTSGPHTARQSPSQSWPTSSRPPAPKNSSASRYSPAATARPVGEHWVKPRKWFAEQCGVIERNMRHYTGGGYRYSRKLASAVVAQANDLRNQLARCSADGTRRAYNALKATYDSFMADCRWQVGISHPRYGHVLSGRIPNQWIAEEGWEFMHPGTSDLSVRRKQPPPQQREELVLCNACLGTGYVMHYTQDRSGKERVRQWRSLCRQCNGKGRR